MRRRIYKGTLVASTDKLKHIKAKRLVVEVLYNFRYGIVKETTKGSRQTLEQ